MKEIFKIECMRAFRNKKFLLMALAGCLIALLDLVGTSWLEGAIDLAQCAEKIEPGYTNVFESNAVVTSLYFWMPNHGDVSKYYYVYKVLIPVMAAIPYGSSYVEDKRSGLINQLILRCKNKKDYYIDIDNMLLLINHRKGADHDPPPSPHLCCSGRIP